MENQDELHNEHDKLFKATFKQKQVVIDYLTYYFPPKITALIDLDSLTLDNTNYVSRKMNEYFSDIVYRAKAKDNKKEFAIALLFEHKKAPSSKIYLQFLEYQLGIWYEDISHRRPLTVVIPIVIYQGLKTWNQKAFSEYFRNIPVELKRFIPHFDYHLTSVKDLDDSQVLLLNDKSLLQTLFLAYKHLHDNEYVKTHFNDFFIFFNEKPELEQIFSIFIEYFYKNSELSDEMIYELVEEHLESNLKPKIMSTYEQIGLKFLQKGKIEGKIEGKTEGETLKNQKVIHKAWLKGYSIVEISDLTDTPIEEVKKIIEGFEKNAH